MFNITEQTTSWPAVVRGYSTNTPVLGGDNSSLGDSNLSLKDLADRTAYLYDRLGRYESVTDVVNGTNITVTNHVNRLLYINVSGNATATIEAVANFKPGTRLHFKCKCPVLKTVTIQPAENIIDGAKSYTTFYVCEGESFTLIAAGTFWILDEKQGNWDVVGNDVFGRFQPRNTVLADGCKPEIGGSLYLRTDLPRLYQVAEPVAVFDATWLGDPLLYRGFFSLGNGTTTFRVPDMRAMFMRGLDLGRGVRVGQLGADAGNFEVDDNKTHTHNLPRDASGSSDLYTVVPTANNDEGFSANSQTAPQGSVEAKPKNIGFPIYIYY